MYNVSKSDIVIIRYSFTIFFLELIEIYEVVTLQLNN